MANTNLELVIPEDNRFVDHVETKLLSPVKESFTPSKQRDKDRSIQPDTTRDKNNSAVLQEVKHNGQNGVSNGDVLHENFVDRQESVVEAGKPDIIESPNKVVDAVFGFINAEAESLDAVNNNSESIQCSDINVDEVNANYETDANQYLGKEVVLHDEDLNGQEKIDENAESNTVDEAPMNLYWYKTNMDVDLAELEAFKKAQNDNGEAQTVNGSIQSHYYKDRLYDTEQNEAKYSNMIATEKKPEEKDTWYKSFESVSSHCLDVTSALKSEPKTKKNIENTSIKETGSNPPWGLEREDRVIEISEARDELPSILSELSVYVKQPLAKSFDLDEADATGYVELKDKEEIQKKTYKTEMQMNTSPKDKPVDQKDVVKVQSKSVKSMNVGAKGFEVDESDAVGYMELKDKNEIKEKMRNKTDDVKNVDTKSDQIDAVGYMERMDKPVEEVMTSTDNKVAFAANIDPNLSIETTEKYAQNVSSQIVKSVTKHLDNENEDSEDVPDGSREVVDEIIERSMETVTKTKPQLIENPFEVKRKFKLSADTEDQIKEMGGSLVETQVFIDEYLDDSSYSILLHDSWLRLRNKQFQMKLRSTTPGKPLAYPETPGEAEIKDALSNIFSKKSKGKVSKSGKPLDVLIDEFGLSEFVTIETTRKTYQLYEYVIDLDLTSLGPESGDIGVVIDRPGQIVPQLQQLDHIAKQIGMRPLHSA